MTIQQIRRRKWALAIIVLFIALASAIVALKIFSSRQPHPTPTITPSLTPLPTATHTPRPTHTPISTYTPEPTPIPTWLRRDREWTAKEQEIIAGIVQGEAGGVSHAGQLAVACNIIGDVLEGRSVARLSDRWKASSTPTQHSRQVVHEAIDGEVCWEAPRCRFMVSVYDIQTLVAEEVVDPEVTGVEGDPWWIGRGGLILICVTE